MLCAVSNWEYAFREFRARCSMVLGDQIQVTGLEGSTNLLGPMPVSA